MEDKQYIILTDLKPANTLFDKVNGKVTIIDLAGVIQARSREELENFTEINKI